MRAILMTIIINLLLVGLGAVAGWTIGGRNKQESDD